MIEMFMFPKMYYLFCNENGDGFKFDFSVDIFYNMTPHPRTKKEDMEILKSYGIKILEYS